jgi:hypothetical protein
VIGPVAGPVVIPRPVGMALMVVVIPEPVGMALVVVVMFELAVIARPLVMALVILELLVMAEPEVMALVIMEPLVMHLVVVVMARPIVNALVLPPTLVVVVLARYDPEQPMVRDQPVRYLVYTIEWFCRHILQGNFFHLQWGCLSPYPHSLISRVAPLVRMHIGPGSIFPQINP